MQDKIAVIVLLYNEGIQLKILLNSLRNQTYKSFKLFLIDNNEMINPVTNHLLNKIDFRYSYTKNNNNIGFAAGNNIGAFQAIKEGFDYVFILNPDMELEKDCLENLLKHSSDDKNVGVVGPLILFSCKHKSEKKIQLFGIKANFYSQKKEFLFANKILSEISIPDKLETDMLSGGSLFIKSCLINQVGLFAEEYFMYNDEIDFFYRVKKAGFKVIAVSSAVVLHHHDYSKKNKEGHYLMYYYMMRNRILFYKNNRLYFPLLFDLFIQFISFPIKLKWLIKIADKKLVKFYYLGLYRGLIGERFKTKIRFK